jgi:hypothetical protein
MLSGVSTVTWRPISLHVLVRLRCSIISSCTCQSPSIPQQSAISGHWEAWFNNCICWFLALRLQYLCNTYIHMWQHYGWSNLVETEIRDLHSLSLHFSRQSSNWNRRESIPSYIARVKTYMKIAAVNRGRNSVLSRWQNHQMIQTVISRQLRPICSQQDGRQIDHGVITGLIQMSTNGSSDLHGGWHEWQSWWWGCR